MLMSWPVRTSHLLSCEIGTKTWEQAFLWKQREGIVQLFPSLLCPEGQRSLQWSFMKLQAAVHQITQPAFLYCVFRMHAPYAHLRLLHPTYCASQDMHTSCVHNFQFFFFLLLWLSKWSSDLHNDCKQRSAARAKNNTERNSSAQKTRNVQVVM